MKFIVDEIPFWEDDCPFYDVNSQECRLDQDKCHYISDDVAGERRIEICRWLRLMPTNSD